MTRIREEAGPAPGPDLAAIVERLDAVHALLLRISDEVGPHTLRGVEALIERYRPEVYAAMEALGLAAADFAASEPAPERLAAAQALVAGRLRELSLTSPVVSYGSRDKRRRRPYHEVVGHVRRGRATGADVAARVLDDYYLRTRISQAFLNRIALLTERVLGAVDGFRAAGVRPLPVVVLQYVGGGVLLRLAEDPDRLDGVQVTCVDSSAAAVRHAEQTLRPALGAHIRILMADPVKWLNGPGYPSESACIVYSTSLLEQLPGKQVVQALIGAHRVLRSGGALLLGGTPGQTPPGEQMIRDWLLGGDWKYRREGEWREMFAQTPFGSDGLTFEYEPLGISALLRAVKG